jgi:hypothetical protein
MLHKVQVTKMVSTLARSSGIDSAEPSISVARSRRDFGDAIPSSFGCGSSPRISVSAFGVERQIHSRTDSDFQNSALSETRDSFAIRLEQTIPHGQIDQVGHDMVVVKAHQNQRTLRLLSSHHRVLFPVHPLS